MEISISGMMWRVNNRCSRVWVGWVGVFNRGLFAWVDKYMCRE